MPAELGDRNAVLSDRRNIVVIADEAHRSQYDFIDGFARLLLSRGEPAVEEPDPVPLAFAEVLDEGGVD